MRDNKSARKKKYMYGKFYHDTYEFREQLHRLFNEFLERHSELGMCTHNEIVQVRNQVIALLESWVGSKKIQNRLGVEIPLHAVPPSTESFLEKQARSREKSYGPCEICGENRISDFCHIVPRSEGGPNDERNYVYLCPNHHHLFDNNRLSEKEWGKIDFSKKLEVAREYAQKVRLPLLQGFWNEKEIPGISAKGTEVH